MGDTTATTVRLLGPVELIRPDGGVIDVPSSTQRRLLALLAIHAPDVVRASWLCQVLDVTPGALRTSIARLRRLVGELGLRTATGGYRLDIDVDVHRACAEIEAADRDPAALERALTRWVGPALEEFRDEAWAVGEARRLDEIQATAVEDLAEQRLAQGDASRVIQDLERHVQRHRFRDRPRGLQMRAMAAAGRQTEALRIFHAYSTFLAEEVGTEPSAELQAIDRRIAEGWQGIDAPQQPTPAPNSRRPIAEFDDDLRAAASSVGRRTALSLLEGAAQAVVEGGPQFVLVEGEVGIGKTTLVAEFARSVAATGAFVVRYGRCDEIVGAPYHPFPSIIDRVLDELPDVERSAHAARHGGDLTPLVPWRAREIGPRPTPTSDERTARQLLFDAVADVVRRAAAVRPIAIVVDDIQWAEPGAMHLFRHLAQHLGDARVLLVLVLRQAGDAPPDHVRDAIAQCARIGVQRIGLDALDGDELAELVHARIESTDGLDVDDVATALLRDTAGHPLFADQMLAHWHRSGRLRFSEGAVRIGRAVDFDIPATLRDLVWSRVQTLGEGAADTFRSAAVLGLDFDERVLSVMPGVDPAGLSALLDRAVAAGVLAESASPGHTMRFAHALVAAALEADLGARSRRHLHAAAFTGTITKFGASATASRLAYHARAGGLDAELVEWSTHAGDDAMTKLAPDEAARWYEMALDNGRRIEAPDEVVADLLVRLGAAQAQLGAPAAPATNVEGAHLAMAVGANDVVVRAAIQLDRGTFVTAGAAGQQVEILEYALSEAARPDAATRALLMAMLAHRLIRTDDTERRVAAANQALDLARATGESVVFVAVAARVLQALWAPGSAQMRMRLAREALDAAVDLDDPNLLFHLHFATYCAAVCVADPQAATASLDRLHEVADEVRDPQMRWAIGVLDAFVAMMVGEFTESQRIIEANFELGLQIGVPEALQVFAAQSFIVGTYQGRHAELLPVVEQVLEAGGSTVDLPFRQAHALVCFEVGRPGVAADLLRQMMRSDRPTTADDFMRTTELLGYTVLALELHDVDAARWLLPQVADLKDEVSFNSMTSHGPICAYTGKLASLLGDWDAAEQHLLDALRVVDTFGWVYHRATTLIALAQNRFWADGHLDPHGAAWLDEGEQLCRRYGVAGWARRAEQLRSANATAAG